MHHIDAQHHAGAPSPLFQLVQLLVKRSDIVDARTTAIERFVQKGIGQQIDQAVDRGIAVVSRDAVQRRAELPAESGNRLWACGSHINRTGTPSRCSCCRSGRTIRGRRRNAITTTGSSAVRSTSSSLRLCRAGAAPAPDREPAAAAGAGAAPPDRHCACQSPQYGARPPSPSAPRRTGARQGH